MQITLLLVQSYADTHQCTLLFLVEYLYLNKYLFPQYMNGRACRGLIYLFYRNHLDSHPFPYLSILQQFETHNHRVMRPHRQSIKSAQILQKHLALQTDERLDPHTPSS